MKRADIVEKERIIGINDIPTILEKMKENEGDGLYRDSTKYVETIWDQTCHKAYKKPKNIDDIIFQRGFFLFNMVRVNAVKYLEEKKNAVPEIEEYPVNFTNENFFIRNGKIDPNIPIVGIDLTAAYWYVARNLGIITEKTFARGLEHIRVEYYGEVKQGDLLKRQRLSALSVLGKPKTYFKIKDGVKTREPVVIGGDKNLDKLYRVIRHTCYYHMHCVKELLGLEEFLCWKTDAIYFHDTHANRKKVMEYFDSVNLEYKILEKEENVEEEPVVAKKRKQKSI